MTLDNMTGITKGSYTGGDLFCKSQLITCNRVNECNGVCPFEDALRHADKAHEADAQTIEPTDCSSCDHYHESETEDGYICECFADTAHTDLISRDALMEQLDERYCKPCQSRKEDYNGVRCRSCWVDDAVGEIEDAPSADRPTIVRCKDCKMYDPKYTDREYDCPIGLYAVYGNDFCSHAERAERREP